MTRRRLFSSNRWMIGLVIFLVLNVFLVFHYLALSFIRQRISKSLVHSGLTDNSFNPPLIYLTIHTHAIDSSLLSIIDNNLTLTELSKPLNMLTIKLLLTDGYHRLTILIFNSIERDEFYQTLDISIGSRSLLVTIRDEEQSIENITVHLHLLNHSHIFREETTDRFGQVTFHHLPDQTLVHLEATCTHSKRYASVEINTHHYQEIILVLKTLNASTTYEDYDTQDRGFYAI